VTSGSGAPQPDWPYLLTVVAATDNLIELINEA
jgi:hypothetical protein